MCNDVTVVKALIDQITVILAFGIAMHYISKY